MGAGVDNLYAAAARGGAVSIGILLAMLMVAADPVEVLNQAPEAVRRTIL